MKPWADLANLSPLSASKSAPTARLVERARAGDRKARGAIYERFARVVHGIVLARVGVQDAEDVTQEVFVEVYQNIDGLLDAEALSSWISAVARHTAIDHLRRHQRPRVADPRAEPAAVDRDDAEVARRVLARVASLPEACRETLVLRLVEGLTGPEIAERTAMTHGSVRVNLTRGMAMLRPLLQDEGWP